MTRYYLSYARQHKDDWQALDGAQFVQIQRGWAVASEGCAGLTTDEQVNLIFGYLNALDGYLERRDLWAELLGWNQRALAAAQSIGNEALVGGLLNDIGLCHQHLGQYEEARVIFERALAVRRQIEDVAGQARTLYNLGLLCADLDALGRAEIGQQWAAAQAAGVTIIASGDRAVAAQNITGSTIVTGDHNTVQSGKYNIKIDKASGLAIGDGARVGQFDVDTEN